jgi:hypothetical protein
MRLTPMARARRFAIASWLVGERRVGRYLPCAGFCGRPSRASPRQEYGGLKSDQVKRLKDLEQENDRLRKAVSDLTLEKLILKEVASGNF